MANDILSNIWPEWSIVKQIGRGSYGVVYEAVRTDHSVESHAAIKVISIPQNESEIDSLRSEGLSLDATRTYLQGVVDDFVSEIQLMESFKGVQNIVSVEDYKVVEKTEEIGWDIYIRMELLTPFSSYISDRTLSEQEVIKLGTDICTALELCARRNVIHRDIKPQNIFVNQFGDFKLGDFGIARRLENVTGGLSQKGSPNYMAPEVAKSTKYDATVDLYSLGIVLYQQMNKNRLPFLDTERQLLNPNERAAALNRRLDGEPLPSPCDASPAMARIILCACSYDPGKRFASATAMKNALVSTANGAVSIKNDELNKTVSVRHASQAHDPDKTTSVRKSPQTQEDDPEAVDTFGKKKKSKAPLIIAVVAVITILIGAGVFALPKLLGGDEDAETTLAESSEESVDGSVEKSESEDAADSNDEAQIAAAIEEAEALAADGDYEGALARIKTALEAYPESETLKAKETEYAEALSAQIKENTLEEAAELAESGDYAAAIALIKDAQDTYGENADYTAAYNTYCAAYKTEVIGVADELANNGDYLSAIQKIDEATAIVGNDTELEEKAEEYEDYYVSSSIDTAETLLASGDFDAADETIKNASTYFPNNSRLLEENDRINNARPANLLDIMEPYATARYSYEDSVLMGGDMYTKAFTLNSVNSAKDVSYACFNLHGKYSGIDLLVGNINGGSASVNIYGDDELLWSGAIDYGALPEKINLEISNISMLKFEAHDIADTNWIAFCDIILHKSLDALSVNEAPIVDDGLLMLLDIMEPYATARYSYEDSVSMGGDVYTKAFTLNSVNSAKDVSYACFNLHGQYSEIGLLAGNINGGSASVNIYGDDELLWTGALDYGALPEKITLAISNVSMLKFEAHDIADTNWIAFCDIKLK